MLPADLIQDIINRLKTIKGQVEGLTEMLKKGEDPDNILNQFKAADKGLQKAHYLLLDEVYRKALAIKIVKTADACPGNCGNEDKIEFIRNQFPELELDDLTKKMKEITAIQERISHYNEENQGQVK